MDWLNTLEQHWVWLALGLILAIAEMAVPGVFLIWLALAALITGLITWIAPIGVPMQISLFALLALVSVFVGRNYLRKNPIAGADPKMNDRGARLVGETVTVTTPIEGGTGRVRHGDSEWQAKGVDAEAGTRMRVAGHDGTVLLVEHLH